MSAFFAPLALAFACLFAGRTFGASFIIAGTTLSSETCPNGAIDPAERVTVSFALQNNSSSNTTNLVATLQASGGVTLPSGPQTYGALIAGGPAVSRSFGLTPVGACGGNFTAILQLQDGAVNLGTATYTFAFGQFVNRISSFSNSNPITIPSYGLASPYPSSLTVSGLNSNLLKVTVTLKQMTHTQPDDVDVLLVGPAGQKAILMADCGGINVINNVTLTFDNAASSSLPDSAQIVSGTYKPTDLDGGSEGVTFPSPAPPRPYVADLSVFNGSNPNGAWQLYILDDTPSFSGNISGGWTLNVTTPEPSCCVDSGSIDLTMGMSDAPDPVVVGNNVTFTMIATNQGPAPASGVLITNPLPANSIFISASASQGTATNNDTAVICALGTLTNRGSAALNVTLKPTQAGPLINNATISANQADHDLSNNAISGTATVIVPTITIGDATVIEGNAGTSTNAIFTLQLSSPSSQTITINYATVDITTAGSADYVPTNGIVTFTPGQTTATVTVKVLGDNLNEATEFFGVDLSNPVNVTIGNIEGTGTITDDDPLPSLSIADASVVEGNSGTTNMLFTVTLTPVSGQLVSFDYATANGSAIAGSDYIATNGTMGINPGQSTIAVVVPVIGDTFNETNETFFMNLSGLVNATFTRNQAIGTIINDDFLALLAPAGAALAGENCSPTNGVIDPNEFVTVNFALRNVSAGTANTTNLTATLLQVGGITLPGAAQTYGALTPGASVSRPFTFTANGTCGDVLMAVLQLQDGANSLGTVTNFLPTGKAGSITNTFNNSTAFNIPDFGP